MSYIRPQSRPSSDTLRASIADADAVLEWAASNPAEAGSLASHTLGITRQIRNAAAADLEVRDLMDRIMSERSS